MAFTCLPGSPHADTELVSHDAKAAASGGDTQSSRRSAGDTPRALASLPKVPGCGFGLSPRSMATTVLGLTPDALASCSCVIALPRRSLLSFSPVVGTAYIIAIFLVLYARFVGSVSRPSIKEKRQKIRKK
jgi:hypothetical protein